MDQFLKITIPAQSQLHDILIAELGEMHYDSFQEMDDELHAYIEESLFDRNGLNAVLERYGIPSDIGVEQLENINWNEQWEKNFDPVFVQGKVQIRATFHKPRPDYEYDIVINPKMSFGTGHHETTYLIVSGQLNIDHRGKKILDLGTGTGILAIMAHKLGAGAITATDVDDWCIDNSRENFGLNGLVNFDILQGTIDKLTLPVEYDIIFANINKNVLMDEMPCYAKLLATDGLLVLSGFYDYDVGDITRKAESSGLHVCTKNTRNSWAMITLKNEERII
jgi:ribosomal protein L11 methyltransferase